MNRLTYYYNKNISLIQTKQKRNTKNPWITPGILKSMKTRNKLYKTYIRKSNEENHKKYKQYRNKLTDIIRNSKKMYYSKELENAEGDIASTWKVINEIICKNKSTKGSDTIKINDQEITDSPEIAQAFN